MLLDQVAAAGRPEDALADPSLPSRICVSLKLSGTVSSLT